MKNIRLSVLVIVAIGLTLVSLGSLGIWGYKSYFKGDDGYKGELIVLKPIDDSAQGPKTSTATVTKKSTTSQKIAPVSNTQYILTPESPSVAVKAPDNETAKEISRLKAEIETLSKNKNGETNMKAAKLQIDELQQKIDKLADKNSHVETENKRLFAVLRQLSDERKEAEQKAKAWPVVYENKNIETRQDVNLNPAKSSQANKATNNSTVADKTNTISSAKTGNTSESSLAVEDMKLSAYTVTDNKEIETFQAYQTDKLVGSVLIKNPNFQTNTGEVIIVITQPDGRVLQKSTWESGTFQSPEGRKVYSCKLNFDYTKGEAKRLNFSLNAANYLKGNYIMQVYCKGVLIGKIVKALS